MTEIQLRKATLDDEEAILDVAAAQAQSATDDFFHHINEMHDEQCLRCRPALAGHRSMATTASAATIDGRITAI